VNSNFRQYPRTAYRKTSVPEEKRST
jgi:hypothetical protein